MPFLHLQTNLSLTEERLGHLQSALTDLVASELGKPKEVVQILIAPGQSIQFAGNNEPNAFVELRALGLVEEKAGAIAETLTRKIESELSIAPDRIFLNLLDIPRTRWGWKGKTFG